MKYTNQLLVNDEMCEHNNDHSGTFPRALTDQNRGYILPVFSYYRIIDNTNSNLICQKFNQSDMTTDIAESQDDSEKIDLKSVIGTENPYDAFEY
ncbi:MAG: hypothetical protein WCE93_12285 [Nitrososphaeraceae archaeon]